MRLAVKRTGWVTVKKAARDRLAKCESEGLCTGCLEKLADGERAIRGMHPACYYATYYAIKTGKITEEDRVREGKMLPPAQAGRKPKNPISIEVS